MQERQEKPKMFKKLKIKKRLHMSFLIVTLCASVSGILGAVVMNYIADRYSHALTGYGFSQGDIGKAMVTFADARSATRAVIGYTDADVIAKAVEEHDAKKASCIEYMETIRETLNSEEETSIYEAALSSMEEFWKVDEQVIELGNTMDEAKSIQAQTQSAESLDPIYDETYASMAELMNINVTTGNELDHSLIMLRVILLLFIVAVIIVSIVAANMLGNNIAKGIAVPLQKLTDRLKTFAAGNFTDEFPETDAEDEVADMVNVAKDMADNLAVIIQDARNRLQEMAKGNYAANSSAEDRYVGEFSELNTAIHQMNLHMNDTLHQIENASDQVSIGSTNLAEAAQSLAEGATEQAGSVEELLATITNITDSVKRTSDQVDESYKVSRQYADEANKSREEMQGMMDAMHRIAETSHKIGSIIEEIEEIASQTNLLALNASIEAARAGEAGKGFAVVADQIGKLADESAQSAVNTRNLITSSIKEIQEGSSAAEQTAGTIDNVVQGINHIAETSKEISDLSNQQAAAMKEAEEGVNQISEVIQANSATAQETSATSEELSAQAVTMDELIKQFTLR